LLPPLPSVCLQPTVGSSTPRRADSFAMNQTSPLVHSDATTASSSQTRHPLPLPLVDQGVAKKVPRLSFTALQHIRNRAPFFSPFLRSSVWNTCALYSRSPARRVWLPSRRCKPSRILGSVFQPPTLLGFALQSFHPLRRSNDSFESIFPLLRFPTKPSGFVPALQRVGPVEEAVSLGKPGFFIQTGLPCSPGPSGLSGVPTGKPMSRASLSRHAPRALR
jgi:hypothetical protein